MYLSLISFQKVSLALAIRAEKFIFQEIFMDEVRRDGVVSLGILNV